MAAPAILNDRASAFMWAGEILDFTTQWSNDVSLARVSSSGGTGAWFLIGESASAFGFWFSPGITGIHSGLEQVWSAVPTASGAALVFAYASALASIRTTVRLLNVSGAGEYPWSARLSTNSATAYTGQLFVRTFYLRSE